MRITKSRLRRNSNFFPSSPIEHLNRSGYTAIMENNTPQPVARGKLLAVAPMMDWRDNIMKSIV